MVMKRGIIAVIPARGGSKRLPKKNIIDFFGKPLIAWTIEAALQSKLFDRIVVSTDSGEISDIAQDYGAEVPFLRDSSYDDHSPVSAATVATLKQAQLTLGETYDIVIQLMANCPLRNSKDIVNAYQNFLSIGSDSQISCFKFGWMNPWWAVTLDDTKHPLPLFPEKAGKRSQDLPPLYCPTGAIWIAKYAALMESGTFYTPGHTFFSMPWQSALDIDDQDDLEMCRAVHAMTENTL